MQDVLKQLAIDGRLLLFQIVAFLITWAALKVFLFDRLRAHLAARRGEEERLRADTATRKKDVESASATLAARQAEIDKAAYDLVQQEVRVGVKRKADAVAAAQDRARELLVKRRAEVGAEHDRLLEHWREEMVDFAVLLAGQLLDRKLDLAKQRPVAKAAIIPQVERAGGGGGAS